MNNEAILSAAAPLITLIQKDSKAQISKMQSRINRLEEQRDKWKEAANRYQKQLIDKTK
jgi:hypothetical protein